MQLIVRDTILVTSIRPGALRRGETITVTDDDGRELIARLPGYFEELPAAVAAGVRKSGRKVKP